MNNVRLGSNIALSSCRTQSTAVKRWRPYILSQYLANLTQPKKPTTESHIFPKFVRALTTLCMLGLKNFSVRFYQLFPGFRALRIIDKCNGRHLFRYGGLCFNIRLKHHCSSTVDSNVTLYPCPTQS